MNNSTEVDEPQDSTPQPHQGTLLIMLGSTSARSSIVFLSAAGRFDDESAIQPLQPESFLSGAYITKTTPRPSLFAAMCGGHSTATGKRNLFEPQDEPPGWETIDLPEPAVLKRRELHSSLIAELLCNSNILKHCDQSSTLIVIRLTYHSRRIK